MKQPTTAHTERVRKELIAANITPYGLRKAEARYLPKIIHKDEHIGGVVYGRNESGSAMLIATDRRIIYLDCKPLFTSNEEVTYDVVSGFVINTQGIINAITLHTKVKDFRLRFVNHRCAVHFQHYVESRHLEDSRTGAPVQPPSETKRPSTTAAKASFPFFTAESLSFLRSNDLAVLSTVDKTNQASGAVVYYLVDEQHRIYILTKAETTKAKNILSNKHVALTLFDAQRAQTLQVQGEAAVETNEEVKAYVFKTISRIRQYSSGYQLPPVAWLQAGMFVVIRITPTNSTFVDFAHKD